MKCVADMRSSEHRLVISQRNGSLSLSVFYSYLEFGFFALASHTVSAAAAAAAATAVCRPCVWLLHECLSAVCVRRIFVSPPHITQNKNNGRWKRSRGRLVLRTKWESDAACFMTLCSLMFCVFIQPGKKTHAIMFAFELQLALIVSLLSSHCVFF